MFWISLETAFQSSILHPPVHIALNNRSLFRACVTVLVGAFAQAADGAALLSSDTYSVKQGQTIEVSFFVSNAALATTDKIEGMTFTVQLAQGDVATPKITAVNLLPTGGVWTGKGTVYPTGGGDLPQYQSRLVLNNTPGDYLNANGLLAKVTFSAVNAPVGDYDILFTNTAEPSTDTTFFDGAGEPVAATFGKSVLHVTPLPEPGMMLLSIAGTTLGGRRRRS